MHNACKLNWAVVGLVSMSPNCTYPVVVRRPLVWEVLDDLEPLAGDLQGDLDRVLVLLPAKHTHTLTHTQPLTHTHSHTHNHSHTHTHTNTHLWKNCLYFLFEFLLFLLLLFLLFLNYITFLPDIQTDRHGGT